MEKKYFKKGNMQGTVSAVILLVTGIGVSILSLIFVSTLGGQTFQLVEDDINAIGAGKAFAGNETFTALANETVALNDPFIQNLEVWQNGTVDLTSKFIIDFDAGTVNLTDWGLNNTALNATYNYANHTITNSIKNGIVSSFEALENTGKYLPVIVLAVIITLVIGMVMLMGGSYTGGGGKGSAL